MCPSPKHTIINEKYPAHGVNSHMYKIIVSNNEISSITMIFEDLKLALHVYPNWWEICDVSGGGESIQMFKNSTFVLENYTLEQVKNKIKTCIVFS